MSKTAPRGPLNLNRRFDNNEEEEDPEDISKNNKIEVVVNTSRVQEASGDSENTLSPNSPNDPNPIYQQCLPCVLGAHDETTCSKGANMDQHQPTAADNDLGVVRNAHHDISFASLSVSLFHCNQRWKTLGALILVEALCFVKHQSVIQISKFVMIDCEKIISSQWHKRYGVSQRKVGSARR